MSRMIHPIDQEDARLDFEVARRDRIAALCEAAQKALDFASDYACESFHEGFRARDDHRVISCVRQVNEYRRAVARLRVLRFSDVDTILMVGLRADLDESEAA